MRTSSTNGPSIYTDDEIHFICYNWTRLSRRSIAKALGRTEQALQSKISHLRASGIYDIYASKEPTTLKVAGCIHGQATDAVAKECGKNECGFCTHVGKFCVDVRRRR